MVPAAAEVEVHEAVLLAVDGPVARLRVRVSAGFYVRSLAHDLGVALGVGAHLSALCRTQSGPFRLENAVAWELVAVGGRGPGGRGRAPGPAPDPPAGAQLDDDGVARVWHGQRVSAPLALWTASWPRRGGAGPAARTRRPSGGHRTEVDLAPANRAGPRLLQPAVILG